MRQEKRVAAGVAARVAGIVVAVVVAVTAGLAHSPTARAAGLSIELNKVDPSLLTPFIKQAEAWNFPIALLVFAIACSSGFAARIFDNRVVFYLGEISYSIYMVHFPLLRFLTHNYGSRFDAVAASGDQPTLWAIALGVLALLIAVSSVCYHTIEVPCRDWVKRRVRRNESLPA